MISIILISFISLILQDGSKSLLQWQLAFETSFWRGYPWGSSSQRQPGQPRRTCSRCRTSWCRRCDRWRWRWHRSPRTCLSRCRGRRVVQLVLCQQETDCPIVFAARRREQIGQAQAGLNISCPWLQEMLYIRKISVLRSIKLNLPPGVPRANFFPSGRKSFAPDHVITHNESAQPPWKISHIGVRHGVIPREFHCRRT